MGRRKNTDPFFTWGSMKETERKRRVSGGGLGPILWLCMSQREPKKERGQLRGLSAEEAAPVPCTAIRPS